VLKSIIKSLEMAQNGHIDLEKQLLLLQDHEEKHFMSSEIVRDIIIGVSDGLTVPFALAAGLSGADVPSSIILIAGIAEVAAGAISMGLGGYIFLIYIYIYIFVCGQDELLLYMLLIYVMVDSGILQLRVKLITT
jgi:hypothetical protein